MLERWRDVPAPAIVTARERWSGRDLLARASGAADWMDALGARPGTPVPALLSSTADAFALVVGGACSARPVAPLGPRHTARELSACLDELSAKHLVAERDCVEVAKEVEEISGVPFAVLPDFEPSERALDFAPAPDSVAFVLHTSGTTGLPKAVPCRQGRLAQRVQVNAALLELAPGAVFATASPFHHISGVAIQAVAAAAGAAFVPVPRFTVEAWRQLPRLGVTHVSTVPTVIDMLLAADALGFEGLRLLQYGASPIHPDTLRAAMKALPAVAFVQLFGQTEGSPITCLSPDDHARAASGSSDVLLTVGRAAPGVELRIDGADEAGVGELVARAPHFMQTDPDGWLRTGDLGAIDHLGFVHLAGRKGDRIIRGGENVYPTEVEHALEEHPGVREVAVVGRHDRRWGETVEAFVVPADPCNPPGVDDLRAHARARLAGFKVPAAWHFVDALPRNPAGKLLRRALPGAKEVP
jgi:acyl-CoA synthetase (AMP-forming)/AMP-acid ligase II